MYAISIFNFLYQFFFVLCYCALSMLFSDFQRNLYRQNSYSRNRLLFILGILIMFVSVKSSLIAKRRKHYTNFKPKKSLATRWLLQPMKTIQLFFISSSSFILKTVQTKLLRFFFDFFSRRCTSHCTRQFGYVIVTIVHQLEHGPKSVRPQAQLVYTRKNTKTVLREYMRTFPNKSAANEKTSRASLAWARETFNGVAAGFLFFIFFFLVRANRRTRPGRETITEV